MYSALCFEFLCAGIYFVCFVSVAVYFLFVCLCLIAVIFLGRDKVHMFLLCLLLARGGSGVSLLCVDAVT